MLLSNAGLLVNGMAALHSIKPKDTYRQWPSRLLSFIQRPRESVEVVNDRYIGNSIKNTTHKKGDNSNREGIFKDSNK